MGSLRDLTMEQKIKAFKKAKETFSVPDGKLILVTEEYYEDALQLCRVFIQDETIARSIGMEFTDEFREMCLAILRHNLSLLIVHKDTGEPMAIRMTRVMTSDEGFDPSPFKGKEIKRVMTFLDFVDKRVRFFDEMECNETILFFNLCVSEKFRHRGLASKIFNAALNLARNLGMGTVCIRGDGTSNFSKRIYEKCGFKTLHEIQFSDYIVDGEQVFCNTGIHKSMKSYGIKLLQ